MPVAGKPKSRVEEVKALLELMKAQGVHTLKIGDIELTMGQSVPDPDAEPKGRVYSNDERAAMERKERRRVMLGASGGIIHRASGE